MILSLDFGLGLGVGSAGNAHEMMVPILGQLGHLGLIRDHLALFVTMEGHDTNKVEHGRLSFYEMKLKRLLFCVIEVMTYPGNCWTVAYSTW